MIVAAARNKKNIFFKKPGKKPEVSSLLVSFFFSTAKRKFWTPAGLKFYASELIRGVLRHQNAKSESQVPYNTPVFLF
jgi:hypothetical protein